MNPEKRGIFITFEGPEGAGKTTQINLIKRYLEDRGRLCFLTREPGGTEIGEKIRQIVKYHNSDKPVYDETELLLFAASRAQHVKELILPALERGIIVLCDRFYDSTTAYQGYARKIDLDFVNKLNDFATKNCKPDLTVLMDLDPEDGFKRASTRQETLFKEDRIEAEHIDFHKKVRDGFLQIAANEPERVKIVQAKDEIENVHKKILELIDNAFGPF
jgi:dTMP kinase